MFDSIELPREAVFATLAILITLLRYGLYFWAIYKKSARPHVFSYLNWGILNLIATFAQFVSGGGLSAWVLACTSALCLTIAVLALFVGEKNITRSDWVAFVSALATIPLWLISENVILTFLLIIFIDSASYYPTYRKSWNDPWGEPPAPYFWAGARYFLMLFAVPSPNLTNMMYSVFLMLTDWGFAVYVLWRRKVLSR